MHSTIALIKVLQSVDPHYVHRSKVIVSEDAVLSAQTPLILEFVPAWDSELNKNAATDAKDSVQDRGNALQFWRCAYFRLGILRHVHVLWFLNK